MKERLTPLIRSEEQFIFLCHLIGPFLSRYKFDRPSPCILDLAVELFTALEQVNSFNKEMKYIDPICDLLYPFSLRAGNFDTEWKCVKYQSCTVCFLNVEIGII